MENNLPLVSICVLSYNHERYIKKCLDSLVSQKTNFSFEIIVHDDASTDNSVKIIQSYKEKFPQIFTLVLQKENQYSKNHNLLSTFIYPKTRGKYLAFCEGDDYWIDQNKLQRQINFLEGNPSYSMCFHDAEIITENGEIDKSGFTYNIYERDYNATELFENWLVPTASIVLRRESVFYPIEQREKIINGDIVIVESCAHTGKVHAFKDKMTGYRISSTGVTWDTSKMEKRSRLYPEHYICLKKNFKKINRRVINYSISCAYFNNFMKYGNVIEKIKWLLQGLFYSPNFIFVFMDRKMKVKDEKRI